MKQLTFKVKSLTRREKDRIIDLKYKMLKENNYRCYSCGDTIRHLTDSEMSHVVPKWGNNIIKYGYEAIHHPDNIRITCKKQKCNSKVMLNVSRKEALKPHFLPIYEDLAKQGYDVTDATDRLLRGE